MRLRPAALAHLAALLLLAGCREFSLPALPSPTSPPSGVLTLAALEGGSAAVTRSPLVTATLSVTLSAGSTFQYELSNGASFQGRWSEPAAANGPLALTWELLPGDGAKTVTARVRDEQGQVSTLPAATIALDTTPPLGSVAVRGGVADAQPRWINTLAAELAYEVGPDVVLVAASNEPLDCTAATYHALPAGLHPSEPWTLNAPPVGEETAATTVAVCFRDAAGNTSQASDTVTFDGTPPAPPAVQIARADGAALEHSPSTKVSLALASGPDVFEVLAANGPACPSAGAWLPAAGLLSWDLSTTAPEPDGEKAVSVRARDKAGNVSAACSSAAVTLDQTPPAAPLPLTKDQVVGATAAGAAFDVLVVAAADDASFDRFEQRGGAAPDWALASRDLATTAFHFTLVGKAEAPSGIRNELRLRAVDKAGNASPEAMVAVVYDIAPPGAVTLDEGWVSNQSGQATLVWLPPDAALSPDVVSYKVSYGPASRTYNGVDAAQGPSPFAVAASGTGQQSLKLTGLTNGSAVYLTVQAVDWAGNVGASPKAPAPFEVVLQPNAVSPSLVSSTGLAMDAPVSFVVQGSRLYAFGTNASASKDYLQVFDLAALTSAPKRDARPVPPPEVGRMSWPQASCPAFGASLGCGGDLVVDGAIAVVATGNDLAFLSTAGAQPASLGSLLLGFGPVHDLAVAGDVLLGSAVDAPTARLFALSLSTLHDPVRTTVPSVVDRLGQDAVGALRSAGLSRVGHWLLQTGTDDQTFVHDLTDLFDFSPATPWPVAHSRTMSLGGVAAPAVSGLRIVGSAPTFSVFDFVPGGAVQDDPARTLAFKGLGKATLAGNHAYVGDALHPGVHVVSWSSAGSPVDAAFFRTASPVVATASYGNYLLAGTSGGELEVLEVAGPQALRAVGTTLAPAWRYSVTSNSGLAGVRTAVSGRYLVAASGIVYDLHAGLPVPEASAGGSFAYDAALVGEVLVQAAGCNLRVVDLAPALDQDPATPLDPLLDAGQRVDVDLTSPASHATSVRAFGHHLLVAEQRDDGTYLEAFAAAKLGYPAPGPLTRADSLASFKVASARGAAHLALDGTLALVSLTPGSGGADGGAWLVDVGPMLDGDATTTMGPSQVLFSLPRSTREGVLSGDWAFLATDEGLLAFDVRPATDADPLTSPDPITLADETVVAPSSGLAVYGSYLFVAANPFGSAQLMAYDLTPMRRTPVQAPTLVGLASFPSLAPAESLGCPSQPTGATPACAEPYSSRNCTGERSEFGAEVTVAGSRAYVTTNSGLTVFELE